MRLVFEKDERKSGRSLKRLQQLQEQRRVVDHRGVARTRPMRVAARLFAAAHVATLKTRGRGRSGRR